MFPIMSRVCIWDLYLFLAMLIIIIFAGLIPLISDDTVERMNYSIVSKFSDNCFIYLVTVKGFDDIYINLEIHFGRLHIV